MCSVGLVARQIIRYHSKSFCSKPVAACYKGVRLPLFTEMPRAGLLGSSMEFEECEGPGEGKLMLANGNRTKEERMVAEDAEE